MADLDKLSRLRDALNVPTEASPADMETDVWDEDYCCNYSADGTKLLDAENFPDEVKVRGGVRVICDGVFSFQDYMAEDVPLGQKVPDDDRVSWLDKVTLPAGLTHIGREAFKECGWLKSLRLPSSLEIIGDSAFELCWSLGQIGCPASLLSIGESAFSECYSLRKVRLDSALEVIGPYAFAYCESLEEINLPSGLVSIGEDAFLGCRKLRRIMVKPGMKKRFAGMLPANLSRYIKEA
ncbi:MAG: leucine-rich repeat domain-containing protein [Bacteroidales bacterium]|nr:leucine-rich repeat domain-containing protein [Bacteroidales bacterium]